MSCGTAGWTKLIKRNKGSKSSTSLAHSLVPCFYVDQTIWVCWTCCSFLGLSQNHSSSKVVFVWGHVALKWSLFYRFLEFQEVSEKKLNTLIIVVFNPSCFYVGLLVLLGLGFFVPNVRGRTRGAWRNATRCRSWRMSLPSTTRTRSSRVKVTFSCALRPPRHTRGLLKFAKNQPGQHLDLLTSWI